MGLAVALYAILQAQVSSPAFKPCFVTLCNAGFDICAVLFRHHAAVL